MSTDEITPTDTVEYDKISVRSEDLRDVLSALKGPPHLIRELQATMGLGNSVTRLIDEFNAEMQRRRDLDDAAGDEEEAGEHQLTVEGK